MRYLIFLAMALPNICNALGADSMEYVGITNSGKVLRAKFLSREKLPVGEWWYGTKTEIRLKYCRENEGKFSCSKERNGASSIVYYLDNTAETKQAKQALVEKGFPKDGFMDHFVCITGCSTDLPKYFFSVGFDGE